VANNPPFLKLSRVVPHGRRGFFVAGLSFHPKYGLREKSCTGKPADMPIEQPTKIRTGRQFQDRQSAWEIPT
jgi:hypothetical protein